MAEKPSKDLLSSLVGYTPKWVKNALRDLEQQEHEKVKLAYPSLAPDKGNDDDEDSMSFSEFMKELQKGVSNITNIPSLSVGKGGSSEETTVDLTRMRQPKATETGTKSTKTKTRLSAEDLDAAIDLVLSEAEPPKIGDKLAMGRPKEIQMPELPESADPGIDYNKIWGQFLKWLDARQPEHKNHLIGVINNPDMSSADKWDWVSEMAGIESEIKGEMAGIESEPEEPAEEPAEEEPSKEINTLPSDELAGRKVTFLKSKSFEVNQFYKYFRINPGDQATISSAEEPRQNNRELQLTMAGRRPFNFVYDANENALKLEPATEPAAEKKPTPETLKTSADSAINYTTDLIRAITDFARGQKTAGDVISTIGFAKTALDDLAEITREIPKAYVTAEDVVKVEPEVASKLSAWLKAALYGRKADPENKRTALSSMPFLLKRLKELIGQYAADPKPEIATEIWDASQQMATTAEQLEKVFEQLAEISPKARLNKPLKLKKGIRVGMLDQIWNKIKPPDDKDALDADNVKKVLVRYREQKKPLKPADLAAELRVDVGVAKQFIQALMKSATRVESIKRKLFIEIDPPKTHRDFSAMLEGYDEDAMRDTLTFTESLNKVFEFAQQCRQQLLATR